MKIVNYRASVSQVVSHNSKGNKNGGLNVHILMCVLNIASFFKFSDISNGAFDKRCGIFYRYPKIVL